jgi:hypothetical protein
MEKKKKLYSFIFAFTIGKFEKTIENLEGEKIVVPLTFEEKLNSNNYTDSIIIESSDKLVRLNELVDFLTNFLIPEKYRNSGYRLKAHNDGEYITAKEKRELSIKYPFDVVTFVRENSY